MLCAVRFNPTGLHAQKNSQGKPTVHIGKKRISKMNVHAFRQNWASVSVTVDFCRSCKDHPKGNGQQCFLSHAPDTLFLSVLVPLVESGSQHRMRMLLAAPIYDSAKRKLSSKHHEQ